MSDSTAAEGRATMVRRRWRRLGPGRQAVVAAVAILAAGLGALAFWNWWTSWPARLVIATKGGHFPVTFSPDGSTLATRSLNPGQIHLWDASNGRERAAWSIPARALRFSGEFSPDGRTFASPWFDRSSGKNYSVDLVDVASGRLRATCDSPLDGFLALRFRDGGRGLRLIAVAPNAGVEVVDFDVTTGRPTPSRRLGFGASLTPMTMSPDGNTLALIGSRPGARWTLVLWDIDGDRESARLPVPAGSADATAVAFSADGKALAVGREDGSIEVWDLASRRLRAALRDRSPNYAPAGLTFSPDGSTLVSIARFTRRKLSLDTLNFFWRAATRPSDRVDLIEMIVIDAATGRRLRTSGVDCWLAVFSPDGRTLATGHEDEAVRVRDAPGRP